MVTLLYGDKDVSESGFVGFNDFRGKKHVKPQVTQDVLADKVQDAQSWTQNALLCRPEWKNVHQDFEKLCKAMKKYLNGLQRVNTAMTQHHTRLTPARSPFTDATVETVLAEVKATIPEKYRCLHDKFLKSECFSPILLNELISENATRDKRYAFAKDLTKRGLPDVSFELFRFSPGGTRQTLLAIWKISNEGCNRKKSDEVAGSLREKMPTFHTRVMKIDFKTRFENVTQMAPSVRRAIYQFLTDDESISECKVTKEVDARMKTALESGDPNLAVDLREFNMGRPEKYNDFWSALAEYTDEHVAAQERRHGDVGYMPMAISIPDLIEQIVKNKLPEGKPVPSETWVRYQFWPKDPSARTATQNTGRFDVRYHVQTRQIRHDHADSHYCTAIFKYQKTFAVQFKPYTLMMMEDDKHFINIGEPVLPLSSLGRGTRVMVAGPASSRPDALDHDFCRLHLTLSVTLVPVIPDHAKETCYQGQVYVSVKDSVFQSSSTLRRAAESSPVIEQSKACIIASLADGGPDHDVRHGQTRLHFSDITSTWSWQSTHVLATPGQTHRKGLCPF